MPPPDEQSTRRRADRSPPEAGLQGSTDMPRPTGGESAPSPELLAVPNDLLQRFDAERRRAAELTARTQRLEAESHERDEFLAAMVHELRTPLTPMMTAIQILREDSGSGERARRYLDILGRNLEAQASLIDDLAELTRIRRRGIPLELAVVDLVQIVARALERSRDRARQRGIGITVASTAPTLPVMADAARLEQALRNVLAYAISQSSEGADVVLMNTRATDDARIELRTLRVGSRSPPMVQVVEHPRTAAELGFLLAKRLLEAQAGQLETIVDSQGALIRIALPLAEAPAQTATPTDKPECRGLHILLVDDHEDSLLLTRLMLERRGHRVATAGSVQAALVRAAEQRFELLISDIGLPDDSGLALLPELARRYPIRGIALSGFGRESDIARSKAAGYVEHLTKPVNMQRLQDVIDRLFSPG